MTKAKRSRPSTQTEVARSSGAAPLPLTVAGAELAAQVTAILATVEGHKDKSGRQVAELFVDLPDGTEYPDYYERIHHPIAISQMKARPPPPPQRRAAATKAAQGAYASIHDFHSDFVQMVENARTYNLKKSPVYRDAGTLMQIVDNKIADLFGVRILPKFDEPSSPTKTAAPKPVWEQCQTILDQVAAMRDVSGRHVSELFIDLPDPKELPSYYQVIKMPVAITTMRQKNDRRMYKTLADLEADFKLMIANAHEFNVEGSVVWNDASTLMTFFSSLVAKELGSHPATAAQQQHQQQLHHLGSGMAESQGDVPDMSGENVNMLESVSLGGSVLHAGDFAYLTNPSDPSVPLIGHIFSIWQERDGAQRIGLTVCLMLRPEQTVQRPNTRFHEKELVRTTRFEKCFSTDVQGRCWVLFVRDFVRGVPAGADPRDVYMCEFRYQDTNRNNIKIKNWAACFPADARSHEPTLELFAAGAPGTVLVRGFTVHETEMGKAVLMRADALPGAADAHPRAPTAILAGIGSMGSTGASAAAASAGTASAAASIAAGGSTGSVSVGPTPKKIKREHDSDGSLNGSGGASGAGVSASLGDASARRRAALKNETPRKDGPPGVAASVGGASQAPGIASSSSAATGVPAVPMLDARQPAGGVPPSSLRGLKTLPQRGRSRYFLPNPQMGEESLADPIVTAFDTTGEGQVKWFAAPPIDVVSSVPPPLHTLDYLYEKARRKAAATTTAGSAPPTQPPAPLARTAAPTATPAVTKSDAHADGSEMDVDEPAAVVGGNPLEAALAALADAWLSEASSLRSSRVR